MIPIDQIQNVNLYSQDDATALFGAGFSDDAAREAICEACRCGDLRAKRWRKRWWFTGLSFKHWVSQWSGEELGIGGSLARPPNAGHDALTDPEPVAVRKGGGR